jgi:hypothetical protein
VTAGENSKGAIEYPGNEMANEEYMNALIDAGGLPGSPT